MTHSHALALIDAVANAVAALHGASPTPRADAEALAMHAFGFSRGDLVTRMRDAPALAPLAQFDALVERRRRGEPIAYLLGRREFWSLDLTVSPATLIPRPETELLVERALAHLPPGRAAIVADLGTGAGAIARECPRARVLAIDCAADALAIARANAHRLGIRNVEFLAGDWLAPLAGARVDMIVSNPPYVPDDDPHLARGDARFEPRVALAGGPDGLHAIRRIAADAVTHLTPGGWLMLEHGWDQGAAVAALLTHNGYASVGGYRDLAGHDRVVEGRRR